MSYWDSLREFQRVVAAMDPLREEIRRMDEFRRQLLSNPMQEVVDELRRHEQMVRDMSAHRMLARDLVAELSAAREALALASSALPNPALLDASTRPFLEVSRASAEFVQVSDLVGRFTAGINSATFLGELDLGQVDEGSESVPAAPEQVEQQLVTLATPDAIAALRAVEFAPIVALDHALRQPEAMLAMDSRAFEAFVAALVDRLGFHDVVLTPRVGDEGRDVLATKRVHGLSILFAFECKRFSPGNPVGVAIARALLGTIVHGRTRANKGVLVTTSRFTKGARAFILTEPALDGRDYDGLIDWLRAAKSKGRPAGS